MVLELSIEHTESVHPENNTLDLWESPSGPQSATFAHTWL